LNVLAALTLREDGTPSAQSLREREPSTTTVSTYGGGSPGELIHPDEEDHLHMRSSGMSTLAKTIMVSGILLGASAAAAAPSDGRWAVRMVTDSGVCDASYNYLIAVEDGRVRYIPQDSDPAPSVSGSVDANGAVSLDIRKSIARVSATGQLKGSAGSGSWRLPGLCSGRWTASKRGPVQAFR
jgi:hypothetical protein